MTDTPSLTGRAFGGYALGPVLGHDWFGTTYEATYTGGTPAVIVVLAPDVAAQPDVVARIERDVAALMQMEHPRLLRVFGFGREPGHVYMAAERAKGMSLEEWLLRQKRMPVAKAVQVVRDAAVALALPHGEGILHGDLTPRAVFIAADDTVQLGRFGRAALPRKGSAAALAAAGLIQPAYWSPEAVDGLALTEASDIYSLGAILYHAAGGAPPYAGTAPGDVPARVVHENPVPLRKLNPDVPQAVATVVDKMMARASDARYARIPDALRDLDALARGGLVGRQKRSLGVAAAALAAVVLAFAGWWTLARGGSGGEEAIGQLPPDDPSQPIPRLVNASTQLAFAERIADPARRLLGYEKVVVDFEGSRAQALKAMAGIARTAERDMGDLTLSGFWYGTLLGQGSLPDDLREESVQRLNLILKEENVSIPILRKAAWQYEMANRIADDKRRVEAYSAVESLVRGEDERPIAARALLQRGAVQTAMGDTDAAIASYELVIGGYGTLPEARQAADQLKSLKP